LKTKTCAQVEGCAVLISVVLSFVAFGGTRGQVKPDEVYVLTTEEHTLAEVEAAYKEMPPVLYSPAADRWKTLPHTSAILRKNAGELKIVMLGDSIVADTSKSRWDNFLQKLYPGCKITKTTCVRGGAGCWWYKEAGRVQKYVLDYKPDLVLIGGISHKDDTESIRDVTSQIHAGSGCDILLMTGAFGYTDPREDSQWSAKLDPAGNDYRARLQRLARDQKTAFLDMFGAWGTYVRGSGKELVWFKRDPIHANTRGEQILGRILVAHFAPTSSR